MSSSESEELDNTIYIHFKDNQREIREKHLITSGYDFISGIGGNLGLFLGFSLFSSISGMAAILRKFHNNHCLRSGQSVDNLEGLETGMKANEGT